MCIRDSLSSDVMLFKTKIIIRLVAMLLIGGFVYLFTGFGMATEPESSLIIAIAFGLIVAILSQAGLLLSTTKFGEKYKLITAALMLPFTLLLIGSSYDVITRLLSGNPLSLSSTVPYVIGAATYLYAYYMLVNNSSDAT